jgi:transposase, IS5 family
MKQQTLSGFEKYGKSTHRAQFLADMDRIIKWPEMTAAVARAYPKVSEQGGRPPDETTICKFRHLLEKNKLGKTLLRAANEHLHRNGIKIAIGTTLGFLAIDGFPISIPTGRELSSYRLGCGCLVTY